MKKIITNLALAAVLVLTMFNSAQAAPAKHSKGAGAAMPAGPDASVRITEEYARMVMLDAYFWAWPMVNIYNRRLSFAQAPEASILFELPYAPLNRLSMLHDYVEPQERDVACPNQDVVYGAGVLALDLSPVVIQVPNFGKRFWVYQIVDIRTDSFADLGAMYGTKPGFYLLVGPKWKGKTPKGITKVFRSKTNTGFVVPRVFQDDTPGDKQAVQGTLSGIDMYPLKEYNGKMKRRDWQKLPVFTKPGVSGGATEAQWVFPDKFLDQLPVVLADAPPLPGEQSRYAETLAVIAAAKKDQALRDAIIDQLMNADRELIDPLLHFRNWGIQLPNHWTTVNNGAQFGTDYFSRTAVAKSNILVNRTNETKYFYQDLDSAGERLNGANHYSLTFAKGQLPPVRGFWSLTLYDDKHFFSPNSLKRYSIGTKNKDLKAAADGSVTIYVQADSPGADKASNWLPAPKNANYSLYVRAYWPQPAIMQGKWTPPAVVKVLPVKE